MVFNASTCGDNCAKYILQIAEHQDITINLRHIMNFPAPFNVGNPDTVTISEWVKLCYDVVGANLETVQVEGHPQRAYFCFHDYDYYLDVRKQMALMPDIKPLAVGLQESYEWFRQHRDAVMRKPYVEYINEHDCIGFECSSGVYCRERESEK